MILDLDLILDNLAPLAQGALVTFELMLSAAGLSFLLGLALALLATVPVMRWVALAYVYVFRGTPFLVQIFMIYYGLPQLSFVRESFLWVVLREPFWCMLIALVLNIAAYTAEVIRGGLLGVPKGLREAAYSLGIGPRRTFFMIVLPIALRLALPGYGNVLIGLLKCTTLASVVTLADVTGVAKTIVARTFAPYEIFITAAIFYLLVTTLLQRLITFAEHRFNRHLRV